MNFCIIGKREKETGRHVIARLTNLYYKAQNTRSICPRPSIIDITSVYIYLLYVDKPAAQHTEIFSKIYLLLDIY